MHNWIIFVGKLFRKVLGVTFWVLIGVDGISVYIREVIHYDTQ